MFVQIDLADGGSIDCRPNQLQYIESFDRVVSEHFPEAKAFAIMLTDQPVLLLSLVSYEAMAEAIRNDDPSDWFEIKTTYGNRTLLRRSTVASRGSRPEGGALITIEIDGEFRTVEVEEDIAQIRTIMSAPTYAELPPGVDLVSVEKVSD